MAKKAKKPNAQDATREELKKTNAKMARLTRDLKVLRGGVQDLQKQIIDQENRIVALALTMGQRPGQGLSWEPI